MLAAAARRARGVATAGGLLSAETAPERRAVGDAAGATGACGGDAGAAPDDDASLSFSPSVSNSTSSDLYEYYMTKVTVIKGKYMPIVLLKYILLR